MNAVRRPSQREAGMWIGLWVGELPAATQNG